MQSDTLKILAVEDNPADVRLLKEHLLEDSSIAFEIVHAETLKDALKLLSTDSFAVALLDLNLPDSTGLEGIDAIRRIKSSPPVIVLTGIDDEETGLLALSRNAQDYLVKGRLDREMLVRSIRYAIERGKVEQALQQLNAELEQRVAKQTFEIRAANEKLEQRVAKRTSELKVANEALNASRAAALNLMEDAIQARQRAEQIASRLHATHARLVFAQQSAGAGIWEWDMVTEKLEWSAELFHLFGLDPSAVEATFESWLQVVHPEDRQPASERLEAAIRARVRLENEYRVVLPTGEVRWINALGDTSYDENGKPLRMSGICLDITERKRAEEALRESREDLNRAQAVAHVGNWRLDIRRDDLVWSDENHRIFGIPVGAHLTYETFLDCIHPDDREYVHEQWTAALRGKSYDIEHRIIAGDRMKWVRERAELEFDSEGMLRGGFGTTQDITERKQAEEELRQTHDYLKKLIDHAHGPIVIWDPTFTITRFNHAFERLTGYYYTKVLGEWLEILFPVEERVSSMEKIVRALKEESGESIELPILRKDGTVRQVLWNSANITGPDGKTIVATIAQGVDITARRELEEATGRALETSRQHRKEVSALLQATRAVLTRHKFEETAQSIFDSCKDLVGAKAGYVALLSKDGTENEIVYLDPGGLDCTVDPSLPMPIRGLRALAFASGKTTFDNDFIHSKWTKFLPEGHADLYNVLFAPLSIEGQVVGLLGLANKEGGFTGNDEHLASAFAEVAAVALLNSRTRESLEESERRFRSVTQTAKDAIITVNQSGRIVLWNSAAQKMFCYSVDEVTGQSITLLMPASYHEAHNSAVNRVLMTGETSAAAKTLELIGLDKNGRTFPIDISLSSWKMKDEMFFTGIIRDVTERKQMEEELRSSRDQLELRVEERTQELSEANIALRASERRVRTLVDSLYDTVFTLDCDLRYAEIFGPWFDRSRTSFHRLIGKTIREVLGPGAGQAIEQACRRVLANEHVVHEWSLETRQGQRFIQNALAPLFDANGNIEGIVGVGRDVTEQKKMEKKLIQTEKLMSIGEMTAMISHEFRNALTSIRMILELQAESVNLSSSEKKALTVALNSITHMESIMTQLLHFSRPRLLVLAKSDLNRVINESLDFLQAQIAGEHVRIRKTLQPDIPPLLLDVSYLKEALINLILNAIQSMASKATADKNRKITLVSKKQVFRPRASDSILVKASWEEEKDTLLEEGPESVVANGASCALVQITDNGRGIASEHLNRIFDPFFTTKTSGTGLGLSVVKRTIVAHGGALTVKSKVGKGTTINIYLPLSSE
jgi:PAS domain S-box-containing protein